MQTKLQDYKREDIKPVWCPGCGDYAVLRGLQKAFVELQIPPEDIVCVSGIGCSGRFSHYLNTYSLHGTHGRALPTALGAKASRPDLTVVAVGGDGDGLGIGGGHIAHAARKNIDLTYIIMDNNIYGLTKGQTSPTTPLEKQTKTSPYGVYEDNLEPIPILLSYDVSFIARTSSADIKQMTDIIIKAMEHKGLSMVYILSPCVTYPLLQWKGLKDSLHDLPDDYTPDNKMKAFEMAYSSDPMYTGIFYQVQKPTLQSRLNEQVDLACTKMSEEETISPKQVMQEFA